MSDLRTREPCEHGSYVSPCHWQRNPLCPGGKRREGELRRWLNDLDHVPISFYVLAVVLLSGSVFVLVVAMLVLGR